MGLKIDGISTSGALDSSGEILDVKGHDISDLEEGRGVLNFEHDSHADSIIGAVIYAKKIYKKSDCETDRQRMFYDLAGGPYVYIIGELFQDEEHPGAVATAAMIQYYHKRKQKMFIGFSIEGSTLQREGNVLKRSVGRRVAITLRPCNKSAVLDVIDDDQVNEAIKKFEGESRIKSFEVDSVICDDPIIDIYLTIDQLNKTLTASGGNVAPGSLVGGAALATESQGHGPKNVKNRLIIAVRDWNRARPLKEAVKAALPEVSDEYVSHFTDLAEKLLLRKNVPLPRRIESHFSSNQVADDDQKRLLGGLYFNPLKLQGQGEQFYPAPRTYNLQNDAGQKVIVKDPSPAGEPGSNPSEAARNATSYYAAAKDFFGMGDHVPVTTHFNHPEYLQDDSGMSLFHAQEATPGAIPAHGVVYEKALRSARSDGTLHKLALMDMILGVPHRHLGNTVIHHGRLKHVDNDEAFTGGGQVPYSNAGTNSISADVIHEKAMKWLQSLDARRLAQLLASHGLSRDQIQSAIYSLKHAQVSAPTQTLGQIHAGLTPSAVPAPKTGGQNV